MSAAVSIAVIVAIGRVIAHAAHPTPADILQLTDTRRLAAETIVLIGDSRSSIVAHIPMPCNAINPRIMTMLIGLACMVASGKREKPKVLQ